MPFKQDSAPPFDPDDVVIVTSKVLDSEGGSISVVQTETPIDRVVVDFPPDALDCKDTVSLGYCLSEIKIRAGTGSGVILVLRMEKSTSFNEAVSITVPYDPSLIPDLVIPYEVDKNGRLHVMDFGQIDKQNHLLSFYTFKPSMCTWVYP